MGWSGYLTLDGTEIINATRTEAYCTIERAPWFRPVYRNSALPTLLGVPDYVAPDVDLAPWYDEDVPDSTEFWGLYPLDVAGIDDSSRSSAPVEFTTEGGSPGRVRGAIKSIVVQAVLVGGSEKAVEYGNRWLKRALLGAVCGTRLADSTALGAEVGYLSASPVLPLNIPGGEPIDGDTVFLDGGDAGGIPADTVATPEQALREYLRYFRDAKVNDGPKVVRKHQMTCGGAAWVVQFTIVAGSPGEFGYEQRVLQGYMDPDVTDPWSPDLPEAGEADAGWHTWAEVDCGVEEWQPIYDPTCTALIDPPAPPTIPLGCYTPPATWNRRKVSLPSEIIPLWGDLVPTLTVYAPEVLRNLRVRWYENADGDFDPDDTPCAFIGDWVISYIPAGGTLTVDGVRQQVRVLTSTGRTRRADSLVFQNDSTPIVWPSLTCGVGYIMTLDLPTTVANPVVDLSLTPKVVA